MHKLRNWMTLGILFVMGWTTPSASADNMIEVGGDSEHAPPVVIRLNNGTVAARYRLQTDKDGNIKFNDMQHMLLLDMTVSFFGDRVRLDFQAGSGGAFGAGWGNTGVGEHDANLDFFMRRLSLTLSPYDGLEFTVGSMAPEFGAGTEDSSFDVNGYIMGYRAKVAIDRGELVITTGNVRTDSPNAFDRFRDLDDINYLQVVLTQAIGEIVRGSLEYNQYAGEHYARAAFKFDITKWTKFLDTITVQDMVRLSTDHPGNAFAVTLAKKFKDLVAGRDLAVALSYLHRTGMEDYPLGEYAFDGHSVRINVGIPNLISLGSRAKLGLLVNFLQNLSDLDQFRFEVGLGIRF